MNTHTTEIIGTGSFLFGLLEIGQPIINLSVGIATLIYVIRKIKLQRIENENI